MIKKFISYYKPHKGLLILDLICALLISATDLVFPMVTRKFVNNFIPNGEIALLFKIGILLFVLYCIRMILDYIVGYYGHVIGVRMEYDMRRDVFAHLQRLPFSYFDDNKTGHIMSKVINDIEEVTELAHHGPEDIFISFVMLIGSFILLSGINVKLTLITFACVPFMFIFVAKCNSKLRSNFKANRENLADINARLEDSISGVRVAKSFTNEEYELEKFNEGNEIVRSSWSKAVKNIGIFQGGISFFSNISTLVVLIFGGYFVVKKEINVGDLVAFLFYINQFLIPVRKLSNLIENYQKGMAGFKRFVELLEVKQEHFDEEVHADLAEVKGNIDFENVTFSYNDSNEVLSNVSLKVTAGETVAIVGPSGAGKTTLCSLIPRFYEIDNGFIKIDGIDINSLSYKSLRKNIGIVQQDVFLFTGTIKENIAYGKLGASEEEIKSAAKAANAHDFIMELPKGYDTYIGERGVKLSGGQKQRLSIARMFLKNPPVLILDEATSSLDNKSEAVIQSSIEMLAKDRTTFIIAHRMATIKNAERIIVLTEKGIEEDGTHEELIAKCGVYSGLYNSQFKSELIG